MKQLTILLLACFATSAYAGTIPIEDAIKNHLVTVTIRTMQYPADDTMYHVSFYGACMAFDVTNTQHTALELSVTPGRFIMPADTGVQRMIITAPATIVLAAQQNKNVPIFAMCTEAHDGAPGADDAFAFGKMATGPLLSVVNFIAQNNYETDAAQCAIWSITDGESPYNIEDPDTALTRKLTEFVCKAKGMSYDPSQAYATPDDVVIPHFKYVDGEFDYTIQKPKLIALRVYTGDEKLVKVLVDNESQPGGTYKYTYSLQVPVDDESNPPSIIIRFYLNGMLLDETKHVLK